MTAKLIQLFGSSLGVIVLGIFLSKYVANYYPEEYVGYLGEVKSYSIFLSNLFLFGLNYSFYFLIKNCNSEGAVNVIYEKSLNLIFQIFSFFLLLSVSYIYFTKDTISGQELSIIGLSVFCALVLSVFSVMAKRDAYNNSYARFFFYTSSNNIILLLLAVLGSFLDRDTLVLIFSVLLAVFFLKFFSLSSLKPVKSFDFAMRSMSLAKYFYFHLFLSTGLLALIQFVLNRKGLATEFNALITIFSLLNVATVVVGNYIFPKLVANTKSEGHLFLAELTTLCVVIASFFILLFFDLGVTLIFKDDFVEISIVSVFLLQSKVLEISSGILGYKLSSQLKFKKIYFGFGLYCLPVLVFLTFLHFDLISLDLFCLSILVGWFLHYLYIVIVSYRSQRLRGIALFLGLIFLLSIQYYLLFDLVQDFTL